MDKSAGRFGRCSLGDNGSMGGDAAKLEDTNAEEFVMRLAKVSSRGAGEVVVVGDCVVVGTDGVLELLASVKTVLGATASPKCVRDDRSVCDRVVTRVSDCVAGRGVVALRPPLEVRLRRRLSSGRTSRCRALCESGGRLRSSGKPVALVDLECGRCLLLGLLVSDALDLISCTRSGECLDWPLVSLLLVPSALARSRSRCRRL